MDQTKYNFLKAQRRLVTDIRDYRKYSMVMGAQKLKGFSKELADFFGYSLSSFYRLKKEILNSCMPSGPKKVWGGRRKSYLSLEKEKEIARILRDESLEGGHVTINRIKETLEKESGVTLHKTTVYRFIKRHDFRKISPRKYHPKRNLEAQTAFKKTFPT